MLIVLQHFGIITLTLVILIECTFCKNTCCTSYFWVFTFAYPCTTSEMFFTSGCREIYHLPQRHLPMGETSRLWKMISLIPPFFTEELGLCSSTIAPDYGRFYFDNKPHHFSFFINQSLNFSC